MLNLQEYKIVTISTYIFIVDLSINIFINFIKNKNGIMVFQTVVDLKFQNNLLKILKNKYIYNIL